MATKPVTEWLRGRPKHIGAYQRDFTSVFHIMPKIQFSWWNGKQWLVGDPKNRWELETNPPSPYQALPYRGLQEKHHEDS